MERYFQVVKQGVKRPNNNDFVGENKKRKIDIGQKDDVIDDIDGFSSDEEEKKKLNQRLGVDNNATWFWKSDADWVKYAPELSAKLENSHNSSKEQVKVDQQRFVDVKQMVQRRYDDYSLHRAVKRVPIHQNFNENKQKQYNPPNQIYKPKNNSQNQNKPPPMDKKKNNNNANAQMKQNFNQKQKNQNVGLPDIPNGKIVWNWKDNDGWKDYSKELTAILEYAKTNEIFQVKVDDQRFVDVKCMLQRRYDDTSKVRAVMRQVGGVPQKDSDRPAAYAEQPNYKLSPEKKKQIQENKKKAQEKLKNKQNKDKMNNNNNNIIQDKNDSDEENLKNKQNKDKIKNDNNNIIQDKKDSDEEKLNSDNKKKKEKQEVVVVPSDEDNSDVEVSDDDSEEKPKKKKKKREVVSWKSIPPWDTDIIVEGIQSMPLPNKEVNEKVSLWIGDITTLQIDAIVNAANVTMLGGGGIDGSIHKAAGYDLFLECMHLQGCKVGKTKITGGHDLPARRILHTVGPKCPDGEPNQKQQTLLRSCYETCLSLIKKNDLKTVAFCCISTGIFGYPNEDAARIALDTVRIWLEDEENRDSVSRIIFCLYLKEDSKIYKKLMPEYFPPEKKEKKKEKKNDKKPKFENKKHFNDDSDSIEE